MRRARKESLQSQKISPTFSLPNPFPCIVTKVDQPVPLTTSSSGHPTPQGRTGSSSQCTYLSKHKALITGFWPGTKMCLQSLEQGQRQHRWTKVEPNPTNLMARVGLAPPACAHLALSTLARSPFAPPHSTLRYPQQPDRPWHSKCAQYRSTCQKFGLQTNECNHTRGKYSYFKGRGPQPI